MFAAARLEPTWAGDRPERAWHRYVRRIAVTFRNVALGALSFDTMARSNASVAERLTAVRDGLTELVNYRNRKIQQARLGANAENKTRWDNAEGRLSLIFVAPEYMFMNACQPYLHNVTDDRFLNLTTRDQIINSLTEISKGHDVQLIFVPGSIAYKKPFFRQGDSAEEISARNARVLGRIESGANLYVSNSVSIAQARQVALSGAFDTPGASYPALNTDQKLQKFNQAYAATSADLHIGENKMYMFHKGKVIASYKKKCDFHEVLPGYPQPTVFLPGEKKGRATVSGVPFGVELCLDHVNGTLSSAGSVTGDLPVVHAVASAWVSLDGGNAVVRPGGYMVHASSNSGASGIWRRGTSSTGGGYIAGDELEIVATADGQMNMAVAEIDFP
jgi:hypothetical protein